MVLKKEGETLEKYDIFLETEAANKNLAMVRGFIRDYLRVEKVNETHVVQLTSVVDELVTNVVEHAYKNIVGEEKLLRLYLINSNDKITIMVEDFGAGINKNSKSKEEGGMGLVIVKKVADEFFLEEKEKGVIFKIIKKVEKEA